MPAPSSDASPTPIQTQVKSAKSASTGLESLPSVGPGTYDSSVIPPSHEARTLVLCFDGTGDQFDSDVRANVYLLVVLLLTYQIPSFVRLEFQHRPVLLYA